MFQRSIVTQSFNCLEVIYKKKYVCTYVLSLFYIIIPKSFNSLTSCMYVCMHVRHVIITRESKIMSEKSWVFERINFGGVCAFLVCDVYICAYFEVCVIYSSSSCCIYLYFIACQVEMDEMDEFSESFYLYYIVVRKV